ncbi:MAG TPA: NADH-quinone oxidoreductase subunit NuoE [Geobacteraceae bacterium]|nr:NADH-quinone oxidoreductase subunit NuoE [Geobacteraceae bacterium]
MIPEKLKKELEARVASAITPREAAVDVMKEVQNHYGWLTDEGVVEAAEILGLSPLQVEELATFYEMIYRRPVGKKVIKICDSISCWTMGDEELMAHLVRRLGVEPGGTTTDGMFTLLPCSCLGNCGNAPAMMVGENMYENLTPDKADEILEKEKMSP